MVLRKKTDVVQLSKIRMRESLRVKLARDAERKRVTLNGEIVDRLEKSYEGDGRLEIANAMKWLEPLAHSVAAISQGGDAAKIDTKDFASTTPAIVKFLQENPDAGGALLVKDVFKPEAENTAARDRRDSEIIDVLLSRNEASSRLLRAITLELALKPDWSSSKSGISEMAEVIRLHVYAAEHRFENAENDK